MQLADEGQPNPDPFGIESARPRPGTWVIAVEGDLSAFRSGWLRNHVTTAIEATATAIVIDLSGVTFMDSGAFSVLLASQRRIREAGADLAIVRPRGEVGNLFALTGLDTLLRICESRDGALDAIAA